MIKNKTELYLYMKIMYTGGAIQFLFHIVIKNYYIGAYEDCQQNFG